MKLHILSLSMLLAACEPAKGVADIQAEDCGDGADNDGDLWVDCEDGDCQNDEACLGSDSGTQSQTDTAVQDTAPPDTSPPAPVDADGDGFTEDEDCDDTDAGSHPGAEDRWTDGRDQDCDGVDGPDNDGDGQAGTEVGGEDCDDTDPAVNSLLEETCDFKDNDCDGEVNQELDCKVYAHTYTTLYLVDPFLFTIEEVTSCPGLFDFDTDGQGNLYGVSPSSLFLFDPATETWDMIGNLNHAGGTLNGFAISGAGTGFATAGNNLYRVDLQTGAGSLVGAMGGSFSSSGDCVTDKMDNLYMSSSASGGDDLIQINGNSGHGTLIGNTGVPQIYGLTSAWGFLFGFTGGGGLALIDPDDGSAEGAVVGAVVALRVIQGVLVGGLCLLVVSADLRHFGPAFGDLL